MTDIREPLYGQAAAEVAARLEEQVRDLVTRQNEQRAAESTALLQALLAPAGASDWPAIRRRIADQQAAVRQATHPNPPQETS